MCTKKIVRANGKDDDTLSLVEFVKLCGDAYGGEKVRKLLAD